MDAQEKQFKDGFNSGYFLAEHDPELSRMILDAALSSKQPSEYAYGLSNGHDTYIAERIITHNKEELGQTKAPEKSELPKEKLADNHQKGFNSGYFLSKYEPKIAEQLFSSIPNKSEYCKGMIGGKQEHDMEKIRERLKDISKKTPPKNDKGMNRER
jgi:hypothetical protein